jgi:hypothetical protein
MGTLGLSFAFCLLIAKNVCRVVFFYYEFLFYFYTFIMHIYSCHPAHIGYRFVPSRTTHFILNICYMNFKLSGEVTVPQ